MEINDILTNKVLDILSKDTKDSVRFKSHLYDHTYCDVAYKRANTEHMGYLINDGHVVGLEDD